MAALSIQNVSDLGGITPTYAAVTASDTVVGGQGVFIHVKNAHTVSTDVTIATPELIDGDLNVDNRVVTVANGAEAMIPVPSRYNDKSTGEATITYSVVNAAITAGAFRGPVRA